MRTAGLSYEIRVGIDSKCFTRKRNEINELTRFVWRSTVTTGPFRDVRSVTDRNVDEDSSTARWLMREHGPLLPASLAAKLLGFKSTDALRQARLRQRLPVPMFLIEGRRGWFASTAAVAAWIEQTVAPSANKEPRLHG
jgi:hypothetical protein